MIKNGRYEVHYNSIIACRDIVFETCERCLCHLEDSKTEFVHHITRYLKTGVLVEPIGSSEEYGSRSLNTSRACQRLYQ